MKMSPMMANMLGEQLYPKIRDAYDAVSIQACKDAGMYSAKITPGMMTGMILETHTEADMRAILADDTRIAALMVECVEAFCAVEKKAATAEKKGWASLIRR
jgi:hypothetical protein